VRGWLADFFRLFWALLYWNIRKSWFRYRRGQPAAPCQSLSDSGRALETQCEPCAAWDSPKRFRRVCPLLVETKEGLRCSVDTADVRPFWARTARYYGSAALALYGVGVLSVFIFLRTVGYPVSILHVGMPPLWHRVGEARGWFFLDRSNHAFAAGRTAEGLLYLANAYEFDPHNYAAGLSLAKKYQAGQPGRSDEVYRQLLREHPDKSAGTAQDWFRALLARGDFESIVGLARGQLAAGSPHTGPWMRALLFATWQNGDDDALRELRSDSQPALAAWHRLLETELLFRAGRQSEARRVIEQEWPADTPPFALYYRIEKLIDLRDVIAALDLMERHPGVLDDEARVTLRLHAFATAGAKNALQQEIDAWSTPRLNHVQNLPRVKILCAHLVRHPDRTRFDQLTAKIQREPPPLDSDSAGIWFSLLCTAGAVDDPERLHEYTLRLKDVSKTPFVALSLIEAFFRGRTVERRVTTFLPILPLPLEVTYALIERYSPPKRT
jgi:hypothetical protein